MRKTIAMILTLIILVSGLFVVVDGWYGYEASIEEQGLGPVKPSTIHSPIHIEGDTDLENQASAEGWNGSGTSTEPYLIENYEIDGSGGATGIYVANTTLVFVIFNCSIHDTDIAIQIQNSSNFGIYNSIIKDTGWRGVDISESNNTYIQDNMVNNASTGFYLGESKNIFILRNTISDVNTGIYLQYTSEESVSNNTIRNSTFAIDMTTEENGTIRDNSIVNSTLGVWMTSYGRHSYIINNSIEGVGYDLISISYSNSVTVRNNSMVNGSIQIQGSMLSHYNNHDISSSNTVNGKPVYYWKNASSVTVPADAGEILLANCTDISMDGQSMSMMSLAIEAAYCDGIHASNISVDTMRDGSYVIWLIHVKNSTFRDLSMETAYMQVDTASNLTLSHSSIRTLYTRYMDNSTIYSIDSCAKMSFYSMKYSEIYDIDGVDSADMEIRYSSDSSIHDSTNFTFHLSYTENTEISSNTGGGANIRNSCHIYMRNNSMNETGIFIAGERKEEWTGHEIDTSNTVNGKPVYYWKNRSGGSIPSYAGAVILANCSGVDISGLVIDGRGALEVAYSEDINISSCRISNISENVMAGIYLYMVNESAVYGNHIHPPVLEGVVLEMSSNNSIEKNTIETTYCSMDIYYSTGNHIFSNRITNSTIGISLSSSVRNSIYHNDFINNTYQATDDGTANTWNLSYSEGGGNYWSDYTGGDSYSGPGQNEAGPDGIGDTPYGISGDYNDTYPLMNPIATPVDTEDPEISIDSPENGSFFAVNSVIVSWTGNDSSSGIDHYEIDLDGTGWNDVGDATSHTFSGLSEGTHRVDVKAVDNVSKSSTDSVNFTVDTVAPDISISAPANNSVIHSLYVEVSWTGNDSTSGIEHYEIRSDEEAWISVGTNTSHNLTVSYGNHSISVRAVDFAGNSAISSINISVEPEDDEPPSLSIILPQSGYISPEDTVLVEWNTSDDTSGIERSEIRLDSGDWNDVGNSTQHSFTGLSEGQHTVYVRVFDKAGNQAQDSVHFIVDTAPPEISIIYPQGGSMHSMLPITLSWSASDSTSGIDHYEISLDGGEWFSVGINASYEMAGLTDGQHTASVRAFDVAGNTAMVSVSFTVDTAAPSLSITYPEDSDVLTDSTVVLLWSVSDATSGVERSELRIDGGAWVSVGSNTSIVLSDLSDSTHSVEVRAFDLAGNMATDTVSFTVESSPPAGTGTVSGRVLDENGNPVRGALVRADTGESTTTDSEGRFTMELSSGTHTLTFSLEGYDDTEASVDVESGGSTGVPDVTFSPSSESSGSNTLLYAIIAVLLIALIASILLMRNKGGGTDTEAEQEEAPEEDTAESEPSDDEAETEEDISELIE